VINDNISSENQIGTILTKEHNNYPEDITNNIYQEMVDNNMLDFPIERIVETNNIVTRSQLTLYKDTCSMFLPDKIYTSNPGVTFSNFTPYLDSTIATWYETDNPDIWYKTYFNDGNPMVIHNKDGINTNYIWGYNHKYPIAKIQGLVNSANIVDIQEDIEEEEVGYIGGDYLAFLKSKFSSIINNADLRLTLYTYSPSLGINSITDPNGNSVYYEYDQFTRLKRIRDSDLNIMRFFKYNYHKGELPSN
jgi:YD repeat-containing protein